MFCTDVTFVYVGDTPRVMGSMIDLNITLGRAAVKADCTIFGPGAQSQTVDCKFIYLKLEIS